MVDLERLAARAQHVAEMSRRRMALRVLVPVAALTGLVVSLGAEPWSVLPIGLLLLVLTVGLRHWHEEGVGATRVGLLAGVLPTFSALLLPPCGAQCVTLPTGDAVDLVCLLAGAAAGLLVAVFADRRRSPWRGWGWSTLVAGLAATLGCVSYGLGALLATILPLAFGTILLQLPLGWRAARRGCPA